MKTALRHVVSAKHDVCCRSGPRLPSTWLALGLLLIGAAESPAQGWSAQLVLSPMPSPFLSDWEMDPTMGELIVTNATSSPGDVTFHYTVTREGRELLRGVTDPQQIGANASVTFNAASSFGGRADWNRDAQDIIVRTGRLPEGQYQACVTLAGAGGVVLVERECADFTIQFADPPFLVYPMNGDTVRTQDPIFEWQPVQLSPTADARVGYVLQVAEMNPATRQLPEVALESNILHYEEPDLIETSHQYPVGALPFVTGRTYAWRVVALDGTGKPAATNQGRSEVWTFVYREPEAELQGTVASVALTPPRDTLHFVGDTVRFEAKAFTADNVELPGKKVHWRSLDSTVARVDTSGVVRGAGEGETRIVATIDGIADSAVSVTAAPTNLSIRFESYDADVDTPSLFDVIKSGSYEEVAPKLMAMLQAGELVIPLPRIPGMPAGANDGAGPGAGQASGASHAGGPSAGEDARSYRSARADCPNAAFDARDPYMDLDRKVFVFYLPLNKEQRQAVTRCMGVPTEEGEGDGAKQHADAMFVVSWNGLGQPRAFLAIKGPGLGLPWAGTEVRVRYLVINQLLPLTVGSDILPPEFAGFFGEVSFDAGTGVTFHSIRRCADAATDLCKLVTWINPGTPDITIDAFAGVTASESSLQTGTEGAKVGTSLALGFSIQATLPVRYPAFGPDSLQLGLALSAQDSVVAQPRETQADTIVKHNQSFGVALPMSVWWTSYWPDGSKRNDWELAGSLGMEVDPSKPADAPKGVVTLQVPAIWQMGILRLGNPSIVVAKPLEAGGEVEIGLSGTWGVGPAQGIGLMAADAEGFEELGRAALIIQVTPLPPAQARDSAISAVTRSLATVRAAEQRVEAAKADAAAASARYQTQYDIARKQTIGLPKVMDDPTLRPLAEADIAAQRALAVAEGDLARQRATLASQRTERDQAIQAIQAVKDDTAKGTKKETPLNCTTVFRGKCLAWTLSGSFNNSSLVELVAFAVRFLTGTQ